MHTGLVFGKSGSIGQALIKRLDEHHNSIWTCSTSEQTNARNKNISFDDLLNKSLSESEHPKCFEFLVFTQGVNLNDSVLDFDPECLNNTINANCTFIALAINRLLYFNLLGPGCSICVVSSIWQDLARNNKLSYTISKSAIKGLVLSLVADLAPFGHRINAVLPGPIDNQMTRANLSEAQLKTFEQLSPYKRLASMDEVLNAIEWSVSPKSAGITGNFIKVNQGFGDVFIV